ncbi:PPOX class probable F420-dependent enzyme [Streptacidiphilus sp. MAP12-16]|uniref:TIGR03668 family PPOX class F420-dependent oxidoreductase n=1 Tax=Streptacidiphilus sp. MAP12-16 TaxID=3156300 RepID=UPI0035170688
MRLDAAEARTRLETSRVARLATVSGSGEPHQVPITFALDGDRLLFVVDHKPKASTDLRRLRNIRENPRVSVLADHYADDWTQLWWVRVDGRAETWADGPRRAAAVDLLAAKYLQYQETVPTGPVVRVTIDRMTGWSYQG